MERSFFEYLSLADVERIHSQFFAWIFSENCNAITQQDRDKLIYNIFKVSGSISDVQTEQNGIDILIKTENDVIVIENKIKSSQHSNQLEKYKKYCEKMFPTLQIHYFFLTLIGEKVSDIDWQRINYSKIFIHLSNLELKPNNNHSLIIKEYLLFLEKLHDVVLDFKSNVKNYDIVFLDGHKKKQNKKKSDYNDKQWFIASNQLETILQRSFLSLLVEQIINPMGINISETRGTALVDFTLSNDIEIEGEKYSTALELQGKVIKFTFISNIYKKSNKKSIENIKPLMKKLSEINKFNYKKLNPPKKLAFLSISKKLEGYYWHKSMEDLVNFIQVEIENGKVMTNELCRLLNQDYKIDTI